MENFNVWVDGAKVRLTRQEFNLLAYLYARANQLCAPREIMEQALEYKNYDEGQETSVVQMAISRLRRKIEPHPHSRCYIQNDRGLGYRLILDPPKSPKQ
jgi:DNA-binding response OmpR family regulator